MRSGKLNTRVRLFAPTSAYDTSGDPQETWTEEPPRWAAVRPISSAEKELADGAAAQVTHEVILRYTLTVKHTHRLTWQGLTLEVLSAVPDREAGHTKLLCRSVEA